MSRSGQPPDLKKYMDKKLQIKLNANRVVIGTLRGFDQFMNLVVDNTVEANVNEKNDIGMVLPSKPRVLAAAATELVASLFPAFSPMATHAISKKRKFVADGVFFAELNEMLTRELAEDGYSGVEVRVTPMRTEIIIRATRT
ncbi:hypothetical protein ABZP36_001131 [Zizania latifolia]